MGFGLEKDWQRVDFTEKQKKMIKERNPDAKFIHTYAPDHIRGTTQGTHLNAVTLDGDKSQSDIFAKVTTEDSSVVGYVYRNSVYWRVDFEEMLSAVEQYREEYNTSILDPLKRKELILFDSAFKRAGNIANDADTQYDIQTAIHENKDELTVTMYENFHGEEVPVVRVGDVADVVKEVVPDAYDVVARLHNAGDRETYHLPV